MSHDTLTPSSTHLPDDVGRRSASYPNDKSEAPDMSGKHSEVPGPDDKMPPSSDLDEKHSHALAGEKSLETPTDDGMKLDIQNGLGEKPEPTDAGRHKSKALRFPKFRRRKPDGGKQKEDQSAEKGKDGTIAVNNDPLQHLPQHEREIIERQLNVPDVKVTPRVLYRYATRYDWLIIAVSALTAIAA